MSAQRDGSVTCNSRMVSSRGVPQVTANRSLTAALGEGRNAIPESRARSRDVPDPKPSSRRNAESLTRAAE
jgi:hypothetical protein